MNKTINVPYADLVAFVSEYTEGDDIPDLGLEVNDMEEVEFGILDFGDEPVIDNFYEEWTRDNPMSEDYATLHNASFMQSK